MRMNCPDCDITLDATDVFSGNCPNCGIPMTGTTQPVPGLTPDLVRWVNIPTDQLGDAIDAALDQNPGFLVYAARWVDHDPEIPRIEGHWRLTLIQPVGGFPYTTGDDQQQ